MKKYKVLDFKKLWPYLLATTLFVALYITGLAVNGASTPLGFIIAGGVATLGALTVTGVIIGARVAFAKKIRFYTPQGCAVCWDGMEPNIGFPRNLTDDGLGLVNGVRVYNLREFIDLTLAITINYWMLKRPGKEDVIFKAFNGATLLLSHEIFELHGRGISPGKNLALGLTVGKQMAVSTLNPNQVEALIKHEAAHVILNELGEGGIQAISHQKMTEAGWNY